MFAKVKKFLDRSLEVLVAISMVVLVLDVVWGVVVRYLCSWFKWKNPSPWTDELATFLMIWVGLLGASVALNRGAHLGIDYFVGKLSAKKRLCTELLVFFCVAVFSLLVVVIGGIKLVVSTFEHPQPSPALGLKMGYVYLAVPISGSFLVLYSLIGLVERARALVVGKVVPASHITESGAELD